MTIQGFEWKGAYFNPEVAAQANGDLSFITWGSPRLLWGWENPNGDIFCWLGNPVEDVLQGRSTRIIGHILAEHFQDQAHREEWVNTCTKAVLGDGN